MASHAGHNHPATPAARAKCRAGKPTFNPETGVLDMGTPKAPKTKWLTAKEMGIVISACTIEEAHCEMCGTTNPEDDGEGYTTCCNEPIVYGPCGHDHS